MTIKYHNLDNYIRPLILYIYSPFKDLLIKLNTLFKDKKSSKTQCKKFHRFI